MRLAQVISAVEGVSGGVAEITSSVFEAALTAHVSADEILCVRLC